VFVFGCCGCVFHVAFDAVHAACICFVSRHKEGAFKATKFVVQSRCLVLVYCTIGSGDAVFVSFRSLWGELTRYTHGLTGRLISVRVSSGCVTASHAAQLAACCGSQHACTCTRAKV
jgi:hypothetical protein